MIIEKLGKENQAHYSQFLSDIPEALIYYSIPFLEHISAELGTTYRILVVKLEADAAIKAAFPFMISKTGKYGVVANSLGYFGSNGGLLLHPSLTESESLTLASLLYKEVLENFKTLNVVASTVISNPLLPSVNGWLKEHSEYDFEDSRIGQITPLPQFVNEDSLDTALMGIFANPRPRNIRKAIKSGVHVYKSSDPQDLDFLFRIHVDNIAAIGGLTKSKEFFTNIPDGFDSSEYALYVATLEGKKIAALLLFYFNDTVEYFTPATIHDYRNLQPSSLIIMTAMKDVVRLGYKYWNWGGTWKSQESLHNFKKKWGAHDMKYSYYTKVFNTTILNASREELSSDYSNFYVMPYNQLKNE